MEFMRYVRIDYRLYSTAICIVTLTVGIALFGVLIFMDLGTENNPISRLIVYAAMFAVILAVLIIVFIRRYFIIKTIVRDGIERKVTIIKAMRFPRDQLACYFKIDGKLFTIRLRISRKNKQMVTETCAEGNEVSILHLSGHPKRFVVADLYR